MVRRRSQLEHLSKDEFIDELMSIEDISSKLANLTTRFDDFSGRFEILSSELAISKNCNRLLSERIIHLERNAVLIDRKNLRNKSENLSQLKFAGKLFISESMCHENHQLAYKCRQLKNAGKIHSTWFWNNVINVKLNERSQPAKIYHMIDIEKLLGVEPCPQRNFNKIALEPHDFAGNFYLI